MRGGAGAALGLALLAGAATTARAGAPEPRGSTRGAELAPAGRRLSLQPDEVRRLEHGDTVVEFLDDPQVRVSVRSMALVDAPVEEVWPVLRDCGRFDEFMPRFAEAVERRGPGGELLCDTVLDLPFPLHDVRTRVRSQIEALEGGGYRRSYRQVKGAWDYERNEGSWTVLPWGPGASRSLVVNRLRMTPRQHLPAAALRIAQRRSAPAAFAAIRARVRWLPRLRGAGGPPGREAPAAGRDGRD